MFESHVDGQHTVSYNRTYVPAILCTDLYSDLVDLESPNYDEEVADEFRGKWVCPNMTDYEIYGDPWSLVNAEGKSFVMIINSCTEAQKYD